VAFDETDDWAHDGRYDRVLEGIMLLDRFLSDLWRFLQSSSQYRKQTTLILTTDHGRGNTLDDWTDHGEIPGAEDIWIAVIGPDTADVGEVRNSELIHQNRIAATLLEFLGLDYQEFNPNAGPPIEAVLDR
jgi:bisphosphoglycerate-independent phosphoglycerate mutase (AlkP superfamily)